MTGYVALVCRISEDKTGRVEGVGLQKRWGNTYAAATNLVDGTCVDFS